MSNKPQPMPVASQFAPRGNGTAAAQTAQTGATSGTSLSRKEILARLKAGKISEDDADALLAALENAPRTGNVYFKVGPSGAVSAYGLQRMPVTLYIEQWERVLAPEFAERLRAFAKEYESKPFHGTRKDESGNVVQYTVTISRKARS